MAWEENREAKTYLDISYFSVLENYWGTQSTFQDIIRIQNVGIHLLNKNDLYLLSPAPGLAGGDIIVIAGQPPETPASLRDLWCQHDTNINCADSDRSDQNFQNIFCRFVAAGAGMGTGKSA